MAANDNNQNLLTDEILIEDGPPAETIVKTAKKQNCDLIVMGTHGQGGITELLAGQYRKKSSQAIFYSGSGYSFAKG